MKKLRREFQWFFWSFTPVFATILLVDLYFSNSPLSFWERLCRPEDICVYGTCIILPFLIYVIVLGARMMISFFSSNSNEQ